MRWPLGYRDVSSSAPQARPFDLKEPLGWAYAGAVRAQALSILKSVEADVERVARRLRKPRRLVLKEAIAEYVARHDPEAVTAAMEGRGSG